MENQFEIEFYKESEEEAFLQAYENQYGELTDEQVETLFAQMAADIHQQVTEGTHRLGKPYVYEDILVGKSDFNEAYGMYLFSQE